MKFSDSLRVAVIGLKTNKTRSSLTILGIVIGIAAIILMVSIGKGAEGLILSQIGGLGADTIIIRPGREPRGPTDLAETIFSDSLKQKDVELLRRKTNVPDISEVVPMLIVPGSVSYEGETFRPTTLGSSAQFISQVFNLALDRGVYFDNFDIQQQAQVAIIGQKVKKELFGNSEALGRLITVKDRKFRVVGIFAPRGQVAFFNVDELVLLPYTTAQVYLLGINHFHEIIVKAKNAEAVANTVNDIQATLRESHGIEDPAKDDFFIVTQQGLVDQIQIIITALTTFLSSVVAIALVVGGIGVMNIMIVSVTERTKEIGLRKAVGATEKDILNQFLLEAIILTSIGGAVGIAAGALFSFSVSIILSAVVHLDWTFVFPISAALLSLIISAAVGLLFGIYPARQAAKKDPIEALRYE